ncbi:hypothetical protein BV20DRAFT_75726 [Pilatotrama ljubarskyi]|nr:hypothetical protein BV20DRAFT_75726 [Pilatotrama ljubarskyi]
MSLGWMGRTHPSMIETFSFASHGTVLHERSSCIYDPGTKPCIARKYHGGTQDVYDSPVSSMTPWPRRVLHLIVKHGICGAADNIILTRGSLGALSTAARNGGTSPTLVRNFTGLISLSEPDGEKGGTEAGTLNERLQGTRRES